MFTSLVYCCIDNCNDREGVVSAFRLLLDNWRLSGQSLGDTVPTYVNGNNELVAALITLESNSLDSIHANTYVEKSLQQLQQLVPSSTLRIETFEDPGTGSVCNCKETTFWFIQADYSAVSSSLFCGQCSCPIPLYKLPKDTGLISFESVISWSMDSQHCDSIYMRSGLEEEFFYRQIYSIESKLNRMGREIADLISNLSSYPVYYSLNIQTAEKREFLTEIKCPQCLCYRLLVRQSNTNSRYDSRCTPCQLVFRIEYQSV